MRKSELRIPSGLEAGDLGEAVAAADGRCVLVSFATAPVVAARENTYVLLVPDAPLASVARSFEWTLTENGDVARVDATEHGVARVRPSGPGTLSVAVRVLDTGGAEQAALSLDQEVVLPSAELETLLASAKDAPGPGPGDPEVLRELVNEHCRYYQRVALAAPDAGDAFPRFLFSMVVDGATRHTAAERREHLERLATAADGQPEDFARLAATGAGVCNVRLALLAMVLPGGAGGAGPLLPWTELPESGPRKAVEDEALRARLAALSDDQRVDLFNVVRFPRSNVAACARILETLRDHYFAGTSFGDVLTGMSGTRAHWLVRHYLEGPLRRT